MIAEEGVEYSQADQESEDCPVTFTKRDGTKEKFVLRNFRCEDRNRYLTNITRRFQTDASGQTLLKDYDGLEAALLTKCMYRIDPKTGDVGKLVTEKEVNAFPPQFATLVFNKAKEVCGLDDKAEESAKND